VSGHVIERRIWVSVSYSNVPESFKITGPQTDGVGVYVRGDDNRVSALTEGDIRVIVSLDDGIAGTNEIQLQPEDVIAPLGVQVFQIEPSNFTVTLERSQRKDVFVRPAIEGTPLPGMSVGKISVRPEVVTLEGPESRFRNAVHAVTQRVNVSGHAGTFSQDVEVGVTDAELRVVQPRTVRVTVQIVPASSRPPSEGR
jgi:YbbR domain-containing protein